MKARPKLPRARVVYTNYNRVCGLDPAKHIACPCDMVVIPCRSRKEARELLNLAKFFQLEEAEQVRKLAGVLRELGCVRWSNLEECYVVDMLSVAPAVLSALRQKP